MANAVLAPRGSPFLSELGNLTPAWHHYLAQIEGLTTGLLATDTGSSLAQIEARISALETAVTEIEAVYKRKNWAFSFVENATVLNDGNFVRARHNLGTRFLIARGFNSDYDGGNACSHVAKIVDDDTVDIAFVAGTYNGNGSPRAWVLGFYGHE